MTFGIEVRVCYEVNLIYGIYVSPEDFQIIEKYS